MSIYSTNILSVGLSVRLQKAKELRYLWMLSTLLMYKDYFFSKLDCKDDRKENLDSVEMERVNLSITDVEQIFTPKLSWESSQHMDDADR